MELNVTSGRTWNVSSMHKQERVKKWYNNGWDKRLGCLHQEMDVICDQYGRLNHVGTDLPQLIHEGRKFLQTLGPL